MNDLNIDYIRDILSNCIISNKNLIGETLFVDTNPALVESIEVKKIDSKVVTNKFTNNYKLNSSTIEVVFENNFSLIQPVSSLFDKEFIKSIENSITQELAFYKKGIYRFISKPNAQTILDNVEGYNWILTSNKIFNYISKNRKFELLSDDKVRSIKLRGRIENLNIFVSDMIEDNFVWKGKSNCCSSVMLNDLNITKKESNIYDVKVDYLFINKDIIKMILK